MDTGSSKMALYCSRTLDLETEGCATDIAYVDPGTNHSPVLLPNLGHLVKIFIVYLNHTFSQPVRVGLRDGVRFNCWLGLAGEWECVEDKQ